MTISPAMDLKGKIAVVLSGGPADMSGADQVQRPLGAQQANLAKLGALGVISLTTPKQVEILWSRQKLLARRAGHVSGRCQAA